MKCCITTSPWADRLKTDKKHKTEVKMVFIGVYRFEAAYQTSVYKESQFKTIQS